MNASGSTEKKSKWPKTLPRLSEEQIRISDDWMQHFHKINRNRFSGVVDFNHRYVVKQSPRGFLSTLDVGAGLGEHLKYEDLTPKQLEGYVALELRPKMAEEIRRTWPTVQVTSVDCQVRMPFDDGQFDRILAIHVLEHLPDLRTFLKEAKRLLRRGTGRLLVVIPCEGGLGYSLGRQFTSKRLFEQRYGVAYEPFIRAEHVNSAREILQEIKQWFLVEHRSWYPLCLPMIDANLCLGLTLRARS
jgi:SAM-dependent methyltransferase